MKYFLAFSIGSLLTASLISIVWLNSIERTNNAYYLIETAEKISQGIQKIDFTNLESQCFLMRELAENHAQLLKQDTLYVEDNSFTYWLPAFTKHALGYSGKVQRDFQEKKVNIIIQKCESKFN